MLFYTLSYFIMFCHGVHHFTVQRKESCSLPVAASYCDLQSLLIFLSWLPLLVLRLSKIAVTCQDLVIIHRFSIAVKTLTHYKTHHVVPFQRQVEVYILTNNRQFQINADWWSPWLRCRKLSVLKYAEENSGEAAARCFTVDPKRGRD